MEIIRIPNRYQKQLSRLSKDDRIWVFDSLFILSLGENIELKDSFAGDILEEIWRECILMDKKNGKDDCYAECESPAQVQSSDPHAKIKESKVKESKINILDQSFEIFWGIYPRKVGKGNAKKSWMKIKPDENICRKIAKSLQESMQSEQWQKDSGQFIPHPATWLNQERWEDEPVNTENLPKKSKLEFY